VHSYAAAPASGDLLAEADYGGPVAAAVGRANVLGVQFHPEKSQSAGLALLRAFATWQPAGQPVPA
jgi:glutamine amidotransferase